MTEIKLVEGDVLSVECDVLLVKYAQARLGVDRIVTDVLVNHGLCTEAQVAPKPGEHVVIDTRGHIGPSRVLVIGTPGLHEFDYEAMGEFARTALLTPELERQHCQALATTIHGAGYGLDAQEAVQRLIAGFEIALASGACPSLHTILFVESDSRRIQLLKSSFEIPLDAIESTGSDAYQTRDRGRDLTRVALGDRSATPDSKRIKKRISSDPTGTQQEKQHVFVAMPFSFPESEDAYELVIYPVVRELGFVCEHVGKAAFAGDVLERIRRGISSAGFMIADLTHARPNVYLEVGFAWGSGIPVVFLAKQGEQVHFDVSTHKCIYYTNHVHLKRQLEEILPHL